MAFRKEPTKDVKKIEKNMHDKSQEKICILPFVTDKEDEENIVPNFEILGGMHEVRELEMIRFSRRVRESRRTTTCSEIIARFKEKLKICKFKSRSRYWRYLEKRSKMKSSIERKC